MAYFPGTSILNSSGAPGAATSPATSPILTVPAGVTNNIAGFVFTNPLNVPVTVSIYRDFIGPASVGSGLLFTVTVPALAGMTGGPSYVQQTYPISLAAGETIYAQSQNMLGGFVNVEVDGVSSVVSGGLSMQQLQLAQIFMLHEGLGVDIPDQNTLNNGYVFQ